MNDLVDDLVGAWAQERPELDCSALEVVVRIQLLGKLLSDNAADALEQHKLKLWEYDVLSALRRQGKPYVLLASELARESMLTSGTITTRVDGLQERGLVNRSPDPDDRRAVRIRLTQLGKTIIDAAIGTRVDKAADQLRGISSKEVQSVSGVLRKVLRNAAAKQRAA